MNIDDLHELIQAQQAGLSRIGDEVLAEHLAPTLERQFVVKVRDMSPQDHMAVAMAKGPAEHARLMQEAARLEAKYG